jgi:hypothetical protein
MRQVSYFLMIEQSLYIVVEEQFAMEITTIPGQWKQGMDDKQQ